MTCILLHIAVQEGQLVQMLDRQRVQQGRHIAHKIESGGEVGVIKAFDGPSRWQVQREIQG
jgi:hypothetical protein